MPERFEMGPEDFYAFIAESWAGLGEGTILYDREIYQAIDLFEKENQHHFFAPLTLRIPNETSTKQVDLFTLDSMLGNSMLRLYRYAEKPLAYGNPDDLDLHFLEANIPDDQLIIQENLYNLVREDISLKLRRILNFNLILNFVIIGLSCVIFGFLIYQTLRFFNKRNAFVDIFMRIRNDDVEKEIVAVRQFYNQLCSLDYSQRLNLINKNHKKDKNKEHFSKEAKGSKAKIANTSNLNFKNYKHLLYVFLFMVMLGGLCMVLYVDFSVKKKNIETKVSQAIDANLLFDEFGVAFLTLYQYMKNQPGLTIRNKPFTEEWERAYMKISNSANFFSNLRQTSDQEFLQELDRVLKEDLCTLMYDFSGCFGPVTIARNGLLSMNSFVVENVKAIKSSYDNSNKTYEAVKEIVLSNTLTDLEWAYWLYQPPGFQALEAILKKQVVNNVESSMANTKVLIITFTSCFFIFIWVFLQPLWNAILSEKILLRKMIRLIPINIIKKNSYIKNYVILTSQELLKSIRNLF